MPTLVKLERETIRFLPASLVMIAVAGVVVMAIRVAIQFANII